MERKLGGRVGVAALDVRTGRRLAYRADERFPMCSTFKWLLAAQVLSRVDAGQEQLARVVPYSKADLLDYAPVTRAHVGEGAMKVKELLAAAIQYSDNTAANLLLSAAGGPAALTSYLRQLGDPSTRLDRMEPDLNSALPGDVRDTPWSLTWRVSSSGVGLARPPGIFSSVGSSVTRPATSDCARAFQSAGALATRQGLAHMVRQTTWQSCGRPSAGQCS